MERKAKIGDDRYKQMKAPVAGAVSGFLTRAITQPLDCTKVRHQLQIEPIKKNSGAKYTSTLQTLILIYKEEGVRGLWKGHVPGQVLSIIYGFGQFAAYDQFNKNLRLIKFFDKHSDVRHTISGGLGGAFGMALSTPFDVIRTRLIAQDEQRGYSSVYGACRHIYKHEGIRGLFRGLTPSIMQIAPLAAIQFGTYNFLVEKCISRFKIDSPPRVFILGAGLLSGIIAKTCVYPLDLTKKRLQIQQFQHNRQTFGQNITTNGMFDCIVQTVSKEGLLGLYKGLTPSIVKAGAMSGFYFFFYEEMRTILDKF